LNRRIFFKIALTSLNDQILHSCANIHGISSYFYVSADAGKELYLTRVLKNLNESLPTIIEPIAVGNNERCMILSNGSIVRVKKQ
jgi:hypothetical protein